MEKILLKVSCWLTFCTTLFSVIEAVWSKNNSSSWGWTAVWLFVAYVMCSACLAERIKNS
jgi:hypothetical protein